MQVPQVVKAAQSYTKRGKVAVCLDTEFPRETLQLPEVMDAGTIQTAVVSVRLEASIGILKAVAPRFQ
jgi:hypothetical protein